MLAVKGSGSFVLVASVIVIISTFRTVSSIDDNNMSRYRKFLTSSEDSLASGWSPEIVRQRSKILATIMDQVLAHYLTDGKLLYVIIGNDLEYDGFEEFLKMESRSVITVIPDKRSFDMPSIVYQKPTGYLLLGIDVSEIIELLTNFTIIESSWNPRGLFITIAQSKKEAVSVMTNLRKKFVYKVIVLVIHNDPLGQTIEAYTWRPYYPRGNCEPPTRESLVRLGTITETLNFKKETDIRPGIMPNNFGNCPLNVSYIIWEPYVLAPREAEENQNLSLEVVLIALVCDKIGVRVNPRFYANGSEVKKWEAAAGAITATSENIQMYDVSIPYIQDSLGWIIPRENKRRTLLISNRGFFPIFWTLIIILMCVAAVSLMAARSRHYALIVWASIWEQPHSKLPNKVRGIWCCWMLVCLHWSTIYRTALVDNLANPFVENLIHDNSDLLKSGLKLGFLIVAEPYFNRDDSIDRKILERYIPCNSVPECYKEIPTGKAVFTNKMLTQYLNGRKDVPESLVENVRHLPPSITYKLSMIYAKGHAMLPAFDKSMLSAIQAGFVEYWLKKNDVIQTGIVEKKLHLSTKKRYLTFRDVRRAFSILAVGVSIAGVSFICEILHHFFLQLKRYSRANE